MTTDTKAIRAHELLPCPFCGSNAHVVSEHDVDTNGRFYFVKCSSCRAKGQESFANETCPIFFEQVRCAWNRRTPNLAEQVNTLTTEKHADAEAIGALEAKSAEVTEERDADHAEQAEAEIARLTERDKMLTEILGHEDRNGNRPLTKEELKAFVSNNPRDALSLIAMAAWVNVRPDQLPKEMQAHTCPHTKQAWARVADAIARAAADDAADALRADNERLRDENERLRAALEKIKCCWSLPREGLTDFGEREHFAHIVRGNIYVAKEALK